MDTQAFETLIKQWKAGKFDPIYLFYGEEDFLIEQLCDQILQYALAPQDHDFNLDILYASEIDGSQLINAVTSYPMMAERRLILVKNLQQLDEKAQEMLAKYSQQPSPSSCLVMTASKLKANTPLAKSKKHFTVFEAKKLYDNKIPDWIRSQLAPNKITITNEAMRLLLASTGNSLRNINVELEKILLQLDDRKEISVKDVERVVGISKQYNIFELCDAVGNRNIGSGLAIANRMLQAGESAVGMLVMLTRHFFILARIKECKAQRMQERDMARELKIHPYFLKNYLRQAGQYSRDQLRDAFSILLDADVHIKSSYQKPQMIMELLVVKLGSL
ncbi:DNA polymerase III subunit delta [candidate division KSB1 bacterium]|nr:DNA polymerase III subunit delta [candidate division KSB1 bacterium]